MSLRPEPLPPIPDATAAAVRAAFPKGNLYVDLRAEFGTLYEDQLFADLYPPEGRPVEVAPWRLALVVVMQYMEGLTDRQAADAVRRCMDWKYALSLDLFDPGFDFTLLHDFRQRLLTHEAAQRLLDTFLTTCKARGWIKARGTQRTDSTHVLAAIRTLHRLECALEAMHYALNQLSAAAPTWVQQHVPLEWYARYGLRSDQARLPKDASKREVLARQVGADGYQLLDEVWAADRAPSLRDLPALEALRQIWLQQYYRCTVPGFETLRWRTTDEQPPAALRITSPYDLEARYSTKRDTQWVGYKLHLTETCEPEHPDLITQVLTTPSTTPDCTMGPPIVQDLAARDLLPGTHLLDSGYVDADFLVTAQRSTRSMWSGRPLGPIAGNIRANTAMTCRPLSWIGRPSRPTVPKGRPVSNGRQATMSRATRSFGSALTGPPVALVLPVRCAPPRKTPPGNSRSGPKPTTRPSRPRANVRKRRSSKTNMPYGLGWRAALARRPAL